MDENIHDVAQQLRGVAKETFNILQRNLIQSTAILRRKKSWSLRVLSRFQLLFRLLCLHNFRLLRVSNFELLL